MTKNYEEKYERVLVVCKVENSSYVKIILEGMGFQFAEILRYSDMNKETYKTTMDLTEDQIEKLEKINRIYKNDNYNNGNLFEMKKL